jgi:hypothetical protein
MNKNVGSGRIEIFGAAPAKLVIKPDVFKPFEGHNAAEFIMLPQGDVTSVDWPMQGSGALHAETDTGVHESRRHDR